MVYIFPCIFSASLVYLEEGMTNRRLELRLLFALLNYFLLALHGFCISTFVYTHVPWLNNSSALGIPFAAERLGDCTSTMIEHANIVEKVANLQHRIPRSIVRTILDRDYYILLYIGSRSAPQRYRKWE